MNNKLITKSNHLIEASYKLSLNEQRIILSCIAQLDGRKPLPRENMFTITATDFAESFGLSEKKAYNQLSEAAKNLFERKITKISGKNRDRDNHRWVYRAQYLDGMGMVKLGFSPSIAPYLTMLHKQFTSYQMKKIANLRSVYAIRLFEMFSQWKDTGEPFITLDDFKDRLQLTEKYSRFYDIKKRVVEPAISELRNKSDMEITWETKRKGRAVKSLIFYFKDSEQMNLKLD